MKKLLGITACCALIALAQPVQAETDTKMAPDHSMTVTLQDRDSKDIGTITIEHGENNHIVTVEVQDMEPGWHAFHIHEKGDCSAEDFTSAGGHMHHEGENHGLLDEEHQHAGDFPNIWVGADGTGKAQFMHHMEHDQIHDADGSAFMIHEGSDDYRSDPSGNAGPRIACGVVALPTK